MERYIPTDINDFERWYADNSGVTIEFLHKWGRRGAVCDCLDDKCTGFQMLHDAWCEEKTPVDPNEVD